MYPGTATIKKYKSKEERALPFRQITRAVIIPSVNIYETSTEYLIKIASPGMQRENFDIEIQDCVITIFARNDREPEACVDDCCEYNDSQWSRAFALPDDADVVLAHGKYKNGELNIRIPRGNTSENKTRVTVYVY